MVPSEIYIHDFGDTAEEVEYRSPLWMVTQDPCVTQLVSDLQRQLQEIKSEPGSPHVLKFSRANLECVREAFAALIRRGEARLHRLCDLLCRTFLNSYELSSVVIGETRAGGERFTLVQNLHAQEIFEMTDLDLGQRQLNKFRVQADGRWLQPNLVANFVEYQPLELDNWGIHRILSRIKAEEEIWNKVVDELFGIDDLVRRDKQLRHLSRYVKDIFGLKVVLSESQGVRRFHETLIGMTFAPEHLAVVEVPITKDTERLEYIEVKNYLDGSDPKRSGWRAIKSVVRWWGETFEIQVQPLRNYLQERERLSRQSHASFKTRREQLRRELARNLPLYGFYRELLQWLFLREDSPPPQLDGISLLLED